MPAPPPWLKRLELSDMADAAIVHRIAFDAALPTLAGLHTPAEDRWFFEQRLFPSCQLWGALEGGRMLGIVAFRPDWIEQLYVLPEAQRRGIGSALLRVAQSAHPRLHLWTFQRNAGARRFYERKGFVTVQETDGLRNEEKEPDVLYRWERPAA